VRRARPAPPGVGLVLEQRLGPGARLRGVAVPLLQDFSRRLRFEATFTG
jgi:hypothetical protein